VKHAIAPPLPHSAEAEKSILAAVLLDSPAAHAVLESLDPSDFFVPQHQVVFRHLRKLRQDKKPANDLVLLVESLASCGDLDRAGGAAYVSAITDGFPRVQNVEHHVQIVRSKAWLRRCLYESQRFAESVFSSNGDVTKAREAAGILSAQLKGEVWAESKLRFRTAPEVAAATASEVEWIVPGYVARGALTEVDAKVKSGKTSLGLALSRAVINGEPFLGRDATKTAVVYLTEQPDASFREAMKTAGLLAEERFRVLTYFDVRGAAWPEVAAAAARECRSNAAALLVVDTLGQFAGLTGDSENDAGAALAAMEPLQRAAADGLAVLVFRHERKSGGEVGDSGRGSSAFAGAADIIVSLRRPEGRMRKTIRRLEALSRFSETPEELLIELTKEGYVSLGAPHEVAVEEAKSSIMRVVPETESEAVTLEVLAEKSGVPRSTVQRAVDALLKAGMVRQVGKGKRGDPLRFFVTK